MMAGNRLAGSLENDGPTQLFIFACFVDVIS